MNQEIENLKHEMYHRLFGHEHSDNETIPNFPRELFEEQAKRRVHLGLLFAEYVKKHEIIVDPERVAAMINHLASAYESPEELKQWYYASKERLADVEALVLEQTVADAMAAEAKISYKTKSYDDVVKAKKSTNDGE